MKLLAVDIETTGSNPNKDKIHGIGIFNGIQASYRRVEEVPKNFMIGNIIVGHHLRFDLAFLYKAGFELPPVSSWRDTALLAHLINENKTTSLKELALEYLGENHLVHYNYITKLGGILKLTNDANDTYRVPIANYCMEDCINTYKLFNILIEKAYQIRKKMMSYKCKNSIVEYYTEEMIPLEEVLMHMELCGIRVNKDRLHNLILKVRQEIKSLQLELNELALMGIKYVEDILYDRALAKRKSQKGKSKVQVSSEKYKTAFNWQSSEHIALLFYDFYHLEQNKRTASGKYSTSKGDLHNFKDHPVVSKYLELKNLLKLYNTYLTGKKSIGNLLVDDKVYAKYAQVAAVGIRGTVTGRLSSANPNMQNLPRKSEIKRLFIPSDGNIFVHFDYSQLELRLAAHYSEDAILMSAFKNNEDLHQVTANALGISRDMAKSINFAIIYGVSPYYLSALLHIDVQTAKEIIEDTFETYKGYKEYLNNQIAFITKNGFAVSETGKVRRLPELLSTSRDSKEFRHALKQGINFPIQSLGASITKRAMIKLYSLGYKIVTQVHDSCTIEIEKTKAKEEMRIIKDIAENIYELKVPLKCEIKCLNSLLETDTIEL